ncbi:MAG: 3-keto-disaccharide hydrolase [Agriterribacter sp.]
MLRKKGHLSIACGFLFAAATIAGCNSETSKEDTTTTTKDSTDAPTASADFTEIFDGKTLTGWDGDTTYWRVEDGAITGEITDKPLKTNSFLIWRGGEPADFELVADFKITESGNSGINYRSEQLTDIPFALKGYQADIDGKNNYTGQNYEERKRTTLAYRGQITSIATTDTGKSVNNAWNAMKVEGSLGSSDSLKSLIKNGDWNEIKLVIKGNNLKHYVNGVLMSDVTDNDSANQKASGLLGFQVHVGPPMKVQYKNIRYKKL